MLTREFPVNVRAGWMRTRHATASRGGRGLCSKIKTSQSQHSKFEHMLHLLGWGQVGKKGIVSKF
jgi:hypothetical protein